MSRCRTADWDLEGGGGIVLGGGQEGKVRRPTIWCNIITASRLREHKYLNLMLSNPLPLYHHLL